MRDIEYQLCVETGDWQKMATFFKIPAFLWLAGRELKAVFQVSGRLWTT
jgi:hypothetical protein